MAKKLFRTQQTKDPVTGITADQELTGLHISISGTYNETLSANGKSYAPNAKNEYKNISVQINSIEDLENAVVENPILAIAVEEIQAAIKKPFTDEVTK